ncbi:hypothetical protein EON81_21280 [bacterium]|nr:MAG: hypothetical protein EON81_21280 [bacterium]
MKNPLICWLLLLNIAVLCGWGILASYQAIQRFRNAAARAEIRQINVQRAGLNQNDAAFLEEVSHDAFRNKKLSDESVARIVAIFNEGSNNPDDRFLNGSHSTRATFCIGALDSLHTFSPAQQNLLAQSLPPFPSLRDHPDKRSLLTLIGLMAKRFDQEKPRKTILDALAIARVGDEGKGMHLSIGGEILP